MSREKGLASFSANFESQMASPIDARMIVDTKADLLLTDTWTANDGGVYTYLGMIVAVHSDSTVANNGVYRLKNIDYTLESSWEAVGSGGGTSDYNFSFYHIAEDVTIPLYQQMIVHGTFEVALGFTLNIEGNMTLEE